MPKTTTIAPAILDILKKGRYEGGKCFLPDGQLDRRDYDACNRVLADNGAKWDKKARAHAFGPHGAPERFLAALESGKTSSLKQETQFFATPPALVARLLKLAELRRGLTALEPSAGTGAIALPLLKRLGPGSVLVCESYEPFLPDLKAAGFHVIGTDFLAVDPAEACVVTDRVVMNPPFTRGADVKHVSHAYRFLKPGGRLVSVMSPSWRHKEDRPSEAFRALVDRLGAVEDVPPGAFRESGTDVATVIVTLEAR